VERLSGIGVSPGIAVGPALVAIQRTQVIRFPIGPDRVARELSALERARQRSREQLEQIRTRIADSRGADLAAIFDAQLLMLDDPILVGRAISRLRRAGHPNGGNARSTRRQRFDDTDDPYLRSARRPPRGRAPSRTCAMRRAARETDCRISTALR
jgi:phosphotransferase system enzyme I (PtsI)